MSLLFISPQSRFVSFVDPPRISPDVDITWSDYWFWLTFLFCKCSWQRSSFILVPVSDRREIKCEVIIVPVFNCESARFVKIKRILDKKPVKVCVTQPACFVIYPRITKIRMLEYFLGAP